MWREVWDETVSRVYKDVLGALSFSLFWIREVLMSWNHDVGRNEPKFGLEPKYNPYAELKDRKRYI